MESLIDWIEFLFVFLFCLHLFLLGNRQEIKGSGLQSRPYAFFIFVLSSDFSSSHVWSGLAGSHSFSSADQIAQNQF